MPSPTWRTVPTEAMASFGANCSISCWRMAVTSSGRSAMPSVPFAFPLDFQGDEPFTQAVELPADRAVEHHVAELDHGATEQAGLHDGRQRQAPPDAGRQPLLQPGERRRRQGPGGRDDTASDALYLVAQALGLGDDGRQEREPVQIARAH